MGKMSRYVFIFICVLCFCLEIYPQGKLWVYVTTKDSGVFRISNFRFSNGVTEIRGNMVDWGGKNTTSMSVRLENIQEISFSDFNNSEWNLYKWTITIYLTESRGFFVLRPNNLYGAEILGDTDIGSVNISLEKVNWLKFYRE